MSLWYSSVFAMCFITSFDRISSASNVTTENYMKMEEGGFQDRHHKLITFNTDENSNISVELSFNVPVLEIPVKRTMDTTKGALANINVGAIVLSGMMVLGAAFAIPFILHVFSKNPSAASSKTDNGKYRREDFVNWTDFLANLDQTFTKNNFDSSSCLQRMTCWLVKNASGKVAKGSATSKDKIIDGIATSEWFRALISETIFASAVRDGLGNGNCSKKHSGCRLSQRSVQAFWKDLLRTLSVN